MPTVNGLYYFAHPGSDYFKPPVILIHGAGGNHLHWPPEIRRLAKHSVFALDLPGHGKSGGFGRQSVADYASCVLAFMDAAGLSRAVFVGHSMGGAIALTLGLHHADRTAGLGLVGSGARLRVAPTIMESAASPGTFPLAVQTLLQYAFSPQADPRLMELAAKRMAETRPAVLHGDFLACDAFDVMDQLDQIRVPTLVICGVDDQLTPLKYSEVLASRIPQAALQTVDDAGHMVMLEQPRRVVGALTVFLATIPGLPGS